MAGQGGQDAHENEPSHLNRTPQWGGPGLDARANAIRPTNPRERVEGEVVGEAEAAEQERHRREVARTPSIMLAAPAFLALLFAAMAGVRANSALMTILVSGVSCAVAGGCFTILAAKAGTTAGRAAWTIGLLVASALFLRAVVGVV